MSAPTNQAVLDKIKKLLRLDTEKGATQAEVEQAVMAAQRLALRHGIDLDEVDATEDLAPPEPVISERFTPERTGGGECAARLPAADKYIVMLLQEFFRVHVIYISKWGEYEDHGVKKEGRRKHLQVFGKKTNVQIATYVYGFLHREFGLLWREYKRLYDSPMSSRNSFYIGLYNGLYDKLRATMGQVVEEVDKQLESKGTTMALILVGEKEKIAEAVKGEHPRVRSFSYALGKTDDWHAINEGQERGRKIEIKPALKE